MKRTSKVLVALTAMLISFCVLSGSANAATNKAIDFAKNSKKVTLYASQKKTLKLKVSNAYKDSKVTYTSSNKKIVKVTKKGVIKALKKGNAKIYASINLSNGKVRKTKCKVKVLQNVKSIKLVNIPAKFYVGEKYQLKAVTVPAITKEKLKWKSSDKKIIKVNSKGMATVKATGSAQIIVKSSKTNKTYYLKVVTEERPTVRFKEGKRVVIPYGTGTQLHFEFVNRPQEKLIYKSADESVATVSQSGYVTNKRPGEVYITVTTESTKQSAEILVAGENKTGYITRAMLDNLDIDDCTNLMIVAHPDDESLWGGAHLKEGKWFVLCMTNQYFAIRKQEYKKVLNFCDAKGAILDYPDIIRDTKGKWQKNNWTYVYDGVQADVWTIVNYKNWDKIVTHSPTGETGHRHHKKVDQAVTDACTNTGRMDKLWYFGKFYEPGKVPVGLPTITPEELLFKNSLLDLYIREKPSIDAYWRQMTQYENWVKATDYK